MQELITEILKENIWAVIGVSENKNKYGYKVYRHLQEAGYKVYPINPKLDRVYGDKCYRNLSALPEIPAVVDFVVPPAVAESYIPEAASLSVKYLWFQPGSESGQATKLAEKFGISYVQGVCMMQESREQSNL